MGKEKKFAQNREKTGRFRSGYSGNPAGRPKLSATVSYALHEVSFDACDALVDVLNDPEASDSEKIRASVAILDRAYGKPMQEVVIEKTRVEVPLVIEFRGDLNGLSK